MTIDQWLHLLTWAMGFVMVGVASGIVYLVAYVFKNEARHGKFDIKIAELEQKTAANSELIGHLVRAGENIKQALNDQQNAIVGMGKDITSINSNLEKIIEKLDMQDVNILQFYRDFDIKRKPVHE